jgi:hypothetical protein
MEQIILVGFFGGEHAILVPSAGNAIPQAIFQWHSLTKLSTSIKASLGGGAHNSSLDGQWLRHLQPLLNTMPGEKPTGCFDGLWRSGSFCLAQFVNRKLHSRSPHYYTRQRGRQAKS